jgi:hypothetical protein
MVHLLAGLADELAQLTSWLTMHIIHMSLFSTKFSITLSNHD